MLSYSVAEPEAELANAPSQEVPQPEVPQERQKQVEPPVADESPKPLKQPVGPSGGAWRAGFKRFKGPLE